jgi:hypothetical protein
MDFRDKNQLVEAESMNNEHRNIEVRINPDGTREVTDMDPVDRFIRGVEADARGSYGKQDHAIGEVDAVKAMNLRQLQSLAIQLAHIARQNGWLYAHTFTPEGQKHARDIQLLRTAAKASRDPLWPELGEVP